MPVERVAGGPFVAVNCAALPETLIEAELFGYRPGAFTGAGRNGAPGRIREVDGGTLFLDEIGDMPLGLQTRLLRVLQDRQVTPLGGGKPVAVDFRLVCATHRNLRAEMHGAIDDTVDLRAQSGRTVKQAVQASGGNLSEAARCLGISSNTLYRKLRQFESASGD